MSLDTNDIIDTKILTKPKPWKGDRADWKRFSFVMYGYMGVISPKLNAMMKRLESFHSPIDHETMTESRSC